MKYFFWMFIFYFSMSNLSYAQQVHAVVDSIPRSEIYPIYDIHIGTGLSMPGTRIGIRSQFVEQLSYELSYGSDFVFLPPFVGPRDGEERYGGGITWYPFISSCFGISGVLTFRRNTTGDNIESSIPNNLLFNYAEFVINVGYIKIDKGLHGFIRMGLVGFSWYKHKGKNYFNIGSGLSLDFGLGIGF